MNTITRHRSQLSKKLAGVLRKLEDKFSIPIEYSVSIQRSDYASLYLQAEVQADTSEGQVNFRAVYSELYFSTAVRNGNLGLYQKTAQEIADCFEIELNIKQSIGN